MRSALLLSVSLGFARYLRAQLCDGAHASHAILHAILRCEVVVLPPPSPRLVVYLYVITSVLDPVCVRRCSGLVRVNLYKGNVSGDVGLPPLPGLKRLQALLAPHHARLRATSGPTPRHSTLPTAVSEEQVCFCGTLVRAQVF